MFRSYYGLIVHLLFFCYMGIPINVPKHNKCLNSRKDYVMSSFAQRLCRWVFSDVCHLWWHTPFNLHYFRPYLFWRCLKKSCFLHFPNKAKNFHYGYDFALKIAHRGNTGSHKGKRKMFCMLG